MDGWMDNCTYEFWFRWLLPTGDDVPIGDKEGREGWSTVRAWLFVRSRTSRALAFGGGAGWSRVKCGGGVQCSERDVVQLQ